MVFSYGNVGLTLLAVMVTLLRTLANSQVHLRNLNDTFLFAQNSTDLGKK